MERAIFRIIQHETLENIRAILDLHEIDLDNTVLTVGTADRVNGRSLLYLACVRGYLDLVKELLARGANPNNISLDDERSPLHGAIHAQRLYTDRLEIVKELLAAGADPNIVDRFGQTPLHLASFYGYTEIVKELLMAGADPDMIDEDGKTSLINAISVAHFDTVGKLLLNGACPNIGGLDESKLLNVLSRLNNYFPTFQNLSTWTIKKYNVSISALPQVILKAY